MVSYYCSLATLSLIYRDIRLQKCCDLEIRVRVRQAFKVLKPELGVPQGHWKYHHSIERIRPFIEVLQ